MSVLRIVTGLGAAVLTGLSVMATPAMAEEPKSGTDIAGKTVYLAAGARLRYGESLLSRVYARTSLPMELKGRGACTLMNCPVVHNNVEVFARRARIDLVKPAGPVVTERTLRRGDDGEDVKAMQEALNKKGAKLTVDGKFGSSMEEAVSEFQRKNGIKADGEIGPATREKLRV